MSKTFIKSVIAINFLIIISCATQKKNENTSTPIQFDLITKQYYGSYPNKTYIHIQNLDELKTVYQQINLTRKPGLPLPHIDFKKQSVIGLFMGQQQSGGLSISIDSISLKENDLLKVYIKESKPEGVASSAITFPFSIYQLNITPSSIVFENLNK